MDNSVLGNQDNSQVSQERHEIKNVNSQYVSTTYDSFLDFIEKSENRVTNSVYPNDKTDAENPEERFSSVSVSILDDALAVLPSDKEVLFQMDVFLRICETNFFFVYPKKIMKEVIRFLAMRKNRDTSKLMKNWTFVASLLSMLSVSSGFDYIIDDSRTEAISSLTDSTSHPGYKYYKAALPFVGMLMNIITTESIQTLLLLGLYMTTNKFNDHSKIIDQGYMFINLAVDFAVQSKLHLKDTFKDEPADIREFQKRLWWSCYVLERLLGINVERSGVIKREQITVELPQDIIELRQLNGRTNHEHQTALIKLTFILIEISNLSLRKNNNYANKEGQVTLESSIIRDILLKLEIWKDSLPKSCNSTLNPDDDQYRANNHLKLNYFLAKIYLGKPFLAYKIENFEEMKNSNGTEDNFVDRLASICIDAAFSVLDVLSSLEKNRKLGVYSRSDLNFCNLSLFVIITFLKIDRSSSTLVFLKKGFKILRILSKGSFSARTNLSRLERLKFLTNILDQIDSKDVEDHPEMWRVDKSLVFPESNYFDNADFQLKQDEESLKFTWNLIPENFYLDNFESIPMDELDYVDTLFENLVDKHTFN
ncbi:uncharacterized protein PRCAT00004811001 [Priceomyces carsonii]|uniref:uncharacterized protein n=1 Tax=Priceomyces carsonii TaxID=28549 RepID=UPI002ED97C32|nr:unnamed protein product [Priceomyces carsonii]